MYRTISHGQSRMPPAFVTVPIVTASQAPDRGHTCPLGRLTLCPLCTLGPRGPREPRVGVWVGGLQPDCLTPRPKLEAQGSRSGCRPGLGLASQGT